MKFLLLGGSHSDAAGKTYDFTKDRQTVIDSEEPLDEMFGSNKFKRMEGGKKSSKSKTEEEGEGETSEPVGENMTDHFPDAQEAGLEVYKDGKFYCVYDKGQCVSGDEEMTRKDQTEAFIQEYVK